MPESQESWEEVGGGTLVKWDEPKTVEGIFQGAARVTGQFGEQLKASILTDDQERVEFYATAILERLLTDPRIQPGVRIRVVYDGTSVKTAGGRMAKSFTVQVAK